MNELALFAGGCGGLLGSKLLGWRAVCYIENDPYCIRVIRQRIADRMLDDAPIWDDVRTFDGRPWAGHVDIVTGGFPCQPWSVAGKHTGELDERNLWPDTIRIIREVRPQWCLLENVPGLLSRSYIRRVFADLAENGYFARWDCIPAAFVGAPHFRNRLWILAHAEEQYRPIDRQKTPEFRWSNEVISDADSEQGDIFLQPREENLSAARNCENVSNAKCQRLEEPGDISQTSQFAKVDWWATEPELGRVANGMANRVDRLRAIGNGQVPAVVRAAWHLMIERHYE